MFKSPQFKSLIAAVAMVGIVGSAAPAMAKAGEQRIRLTVEKRSGDTVYCTRQNVTGSMTPLKTCFTQEEWAQHGAEFTVPTNGLAVATAHNKASQN